MKILAIDPGTRESGMVIWQHDPGGEPRLHHTQVIGNEDLAAGLHDLGRTWPPGFDVVWCEAVKSYGNIVGHDIEETMYWIGELRRRTKDIPLPWHTVSRATVRTYHCRSRKANDSSVRKALLERYGYWEHGSTGQGVKEHPGLLYGVRKHAWQALALAVYAVDTYYGGEWQVADGSLC